MRRIVQLGTALTPWHRCPGCGALHDAATQFDGPAEQPQNGAAFICWDCGCLGIFDSAVEGGVRLPTGDEAAEYRAEENVALALAAVNDVRRRRS